MRGIYEYVAMATEGICVIDGPLGVAYGEMVDEARTKYIHIFMFDI